MNTRHMIRLGAVLFSTLVAAACSSGGGSGSTQDGGGGNSSGGGNGSCKTYVACDELSASDVSTALGVASISAGMESDMTLGTLNFYGCDFGQGTPSVSLTFNCVPNVTHQDTSATAAGSLGGGGDAVVTPVSGIGDAAYWVTQAPDSGKGFGDVKLFIVFFGGNSNFTLSLILPSDYTGDPQAAATAMARIVAGKL